MCVTLHRKGYTTESCIRSNIVLHYKKIWLLLFII